jgi:exopolysaccharide biosynthesis polyprenyl glycosylphosphotransferase
VSVANGTPGPGVDLIATADAEALADGSVAPAIKARTSRVRRVSRRRWLTRLLVATDVLAVSTALAASWLGVQLLDARLPEIAVLFAAPPLFLVVAQFTGLYGRDEERPDHATTDDLPAIFQAATVTAWLLLLLEWATAAVAPPLTVFAAFWATALVLVPATRTGLRVLARSRGWFAQNAVIVGAGEVGQLVASKMLQRPSFGINLVGFVDAEPRPAADGLEHVARLGPPERLPEVIEQLDVDRVVIAFSRASHAETVALLRLLRDYDVQIEIVPRLFEGFGTRVGVHALKGLSLVSLPPRRRSPGALALKRGVDILGASVALVALSPVLAYLALRIKRDSRGPVFYRHNRVGQHGAPFRLYKFRTMRQEFCRGSEYGGEGAEAAFARLMDDPVAKAEFEDSYKLTADPRVTRFGQILRRTSLDELPQLINVLRGELSLVGPRPITVDELPRYGDRARDLLQVRPGLTGHWQVSGRSQVSYPERVRLDLSYVSGWSLRGDVAILAKTVARLWSAQQDAV